MGYRISLYRCPKKDADAIRNITDNDIDEDYSMIKILEHEEIKYDTLANVLDTGMEVENNLCSRFFTNKLDVECDMSFYTISKDQLKNIIEYIRKNNIYEWGISHSVNYDKKEIGKDLLRPWEDKDWDTAVRLVCINAREDAEFWNYGYKLESGDMKYFNIDTSDNKWLVSDAMSYKYAIFNFIHILKIFDWENDYLIAIGG